jgi:hypothetical protein
MRVALVMTATGKNSPSLPHCSCSTTDLFCSFRLPNAGQFNGTGGPEDDIKIQSQNRGGDQEVPDLQDLKRRGVAQ